MPRKKRASLKRDIIPDPKYNDLLVAKLMNQIMLSGKKAAAEKIVYGAFDIIENQKKENPVRVFKEAMEKVKPMLEVRSRRVGGANYQVPMEVRSDRRNTLGLRWMILAARKRKGKDMKSSLAEEILEAFEGRGEAVKKREDTHRMAEANKAFAHFRW